MKRPDITLSYIDSSGPRHLPCSDGTVVVKATPCPVCDGAIEKGDLISKIGTVDHGAQWAHKDCAEKVFDSQSVRNAWVMLGADAARRPRAYHAKDLTIILEHLVQIAYRDEYLDDEADDQFDDEEAAESIEDDARRKTMAETIVSGRRDDGSYTAEALHALINLAAEGGEWPA